MPEAEFDLIHLRLLLAWLTDSDAALRRLTAALKPGGCLVAEEMDFVSVAVEPSVASPARETFERVLEAHNAVLAGQHAFELPTTAAGWWTSTRRVLPTLALRVARRSGEAETRVPRCGD